MPAIVKFRHYEYLVQSETQAMAVMKAMSNAIEVERHYCTKHGDCFYPSESNQRSLELSVTIIQARQLIARKPEHGEEPEFIITPPPRKPRGLLRQPRLLLKG
jgi:hypothetical protein